MPARQSFEYCRLALKRGASNAPRRVPGSRALAQLCCTRYTSKLSAQTSRAMFTRGLIWHSTLTRTVTLIGVILRPGVAYVE